MRSKLFFSSALALLLSACGDPPPVEICNDEQDNDGDARIDCGDPDCGCVVEDCTDDVDNDEDGDIDCLDSDCSLADICNGREECDDNFDNDSDGFLDCEDADCFGDPACPPPPNQATLDLNDGGVGLLDYSENVPTGSFFGHPTETGDINGDGFADVVSCAITADINGKNAAGAVTIFLSAGAGSIDGSTILPGDPNTVRITGQRPLDFLGASAHVADVTGDGFDDVIIGVQGYDGPGNNKPMSGSVVVILGSDNLPATIDLEAPPVGVSIVEIFGHRTNDRLGIWVGAGDVDGDGIQDLLLGADQFDGEDPNDLDGDGVIAEDRINAGAVYVIKGSPTLSSPINLATTNVGQNGLIARIIGEEQGDHLGGTLFGGDIDGDGVDELVAASVMARLSASIGDDAIGEEPIGDSGADGPNNSRPRAGDVHVFFGPIAGDIDLAEGLPSNDLLMFGAAEDDHFGEEIVIADMDGNALNGADLLFGALTASRADALAVGVTYLVRGENLRNFAGGSIDMLTPPVGLVTEFLGDEQGEISGDTLAVPDLDGDGVREIAIARPDRTVRRNGQDITNAGRVTVFYDVQSLPPFIDLRDIDDTFSFVEILGIDEDDTLAYSMTSADVDGDGQEEVITNLMRGDGPQNQFPDAGEIYVVSGVRISTLIGR